MENNRTQVRQTKLMRLLVLLLFLFFITPYSTQGQQQNLTNISFPGNEIGGMAEDMLVVNDKVFIYTLKAIKVFVDGNGPPVEIPLPSNSSIGVGEVSVARQYLNQYDSIPYHGL